MTVLLDTAAAGVPAEDIFYSPMVLLRTMDNGTLLAFIVVHIKMKYKAPERRGGKKGITLLKLLIQPYLKYPQPIIYFCLRGLFPLTIIWTNMFTHYSLNIYAYYHLDDVS